MLHQSVIDILNQQVNFELHSSNIYLQMSNWARANGYHGAAAFLKGHAEEEYVHMQKIWNFLEDNGVRPRLGTIPAVEIPNYGLKAVLQQAYEHEKFVTGAINNCVAVAQAANDFKTFNFLQWFIDEQVEEEQLFSDVLAKFDIAGEDGVSLYLIDRDLATIH